MRTKTLLMALAALAAGVLSSNAQPVYSANIVGYVNQPLISGYNLVVPPISTSSSNSASAELVFPALIPGDVLFVWKPDGSGYNVALYGGPGAWYDGFSFAPISTPALKMGAAVCYQNNSGP